MQAINEAFGALRQKNDNNRGEIRMKINVNKKSGKHFGLAAVLMLAAMLVCTGCPNAEGGTSGGSTTRLPLLVVIML